MPRIATAPRLSSLVGFAAIAATILSAPAPATAQGDLLIAPTRLVLDGRRGGEIILSNVGNEAATYRVSLELRRMDSEGYLHEVEDADVTASEQAALDMVRYAPRRVTLPPDQPQSIRISARPGAELPDGEYRVHMSFDALPKVTAVSNEPAPGEGVAIRLTPIYGITMPIIVRKGQLEVTAGLANPAIEQGERGPTFAIDIIRQGAASIYGDLLVYKQGIADPVFVVRGLGVYPEIQARRSTFALDPEQAAIMKGPVRVEFREALGSGGGILAELDTVLR